MIIAKNEISTLRYLEENDLEILSQYANNPKIAINLRDAFPHPYSYKDALLFFNMVQSQNPITTFVIEHNGEFVGMIGLLPLGDVYKKTAEIGYWLAEPFWNKGIATASVKLLVDWGWKNLDIIRIHTGIFSYNPASARVLEKAGFSFEYECKNAVFKNGKIANELKYCILKP